MSDETLDDAKLKLFLATTKDFTDLKLISFSGGEVFLDFERLKDLTQYTYKLGKSVSCVTNCFWANSYEKTFKMLAELKKDGMSFISVSCDSFHQKTIPVSNVKNVLYACKELYIPVKMGSIITKTNTAIQTAEMLGESIIGVSINFSPCLQTGRAKKKISKKDILKLYDSKNQYCTGWGYMTLMYNGDIYPCCSQVIGEAELQIGNYNELNYGQCIEKFNRNSLLLLLKKKGFNPFIDFARSELNITVPDKITHSCELCQILFGSNIIEKYHPLIQQFIEGM